MTGTPKNVKWLSLMELANHFYRPRRKGYIFVINTGLKNDFYIRKGHKVTHF